MLYKFTLNCNKKNRWVRKVKTIKLNNKIMNKKIKRVTNQ